jgi:hypothetical protein
MKTDNFVPIAAPKRTPRPAPEINTSKTTQLVDELARKVIQRVLIDMRSKEQGGYTSLSDGAWCFVSTSLGQFTANELDALFAFAGIVPDEVEVVGSCADCANSNDGHERGYSKPCVMCLRPSHINHFVPREKLARGKKR